MTNMGILIKIGAKYIELLSHIFPKLTLILFTQFLIASK